MVSSQSRSPSPSELQSINDMSSVGPTNGKAGQTHFEQRAFISLETQIALNEEKIKRKFNSKVIFEWCYFSWPTAKTLLVTVLHRTEWPLDVNDTSLLIWPNVE